MAGKYVLRMRQPPIKVIGCLVGKSLGRAHEVGVCPCKLFRHSKVTRYGMQLRGNIHTHVVVRQDRRPVRYLLLVKDHRPIDERDTTI